MRRDLDLVVSDDACLCRRETGQPLTLVLPQGAEDAHERKERFYKLDSATCARCGECVSVTIMVSMP